jgi:flagellar hook-associated protein 3 FlgL
MIRATRNGLNDLISQNLFRISARLRQAEEQAVTGRSVNRPSDDPPTVSESHRLFSSIEDQDMYKKNSEYAEGLLTIMDTALGNVSDILIRASEIAVAMAGDTVDANTRNVSATEVTELLSSLIDQVNTDISGRYIFSGASYQVAAFSNAGLYLGDGNTPSTKVGENRWVQTGYDGSQVFQGTIDVFAVMNNLIAGLQADNDAAVEASIADLDTAQVQNAFWRSTVGSEANAAEDALLVAEGLDQVLSARLDEVIGIDEGTAYLSLSELQTTYQAVLQVSATSSRSTLFDIL